MNKKAIVLMSGGLDSSLAARIMQDQGVELEALHYVTVFSPSAREGRKSYAKEMAKSLKMNLTVKNVTQEFIDVVKSPDHGYGSNINPCIDCRIFIFKKAKEYMKDASASFIVTGEVFGQRPMSQRRDAMNIIDKAAGVEGIILRPLCAKLLKPTIPEQEGIVDRERLFDIQGRSRKRQFALAKEYGITEYSSPAGGCLLTDPGFAKRSRDLMENGDFDLENIKLLKLGRHFRLAKDSKLIVGRNKAENEAIFSLSGDRDILMKAKTLPGPISLLRGEHTADIVNLALGITARYVDMPDSVSPVEMEYWDQKTITPSCINIAPLDPRKLDAYRV